MSNLSNYPIIHMVLPNELPRSLEQMKQSITAQISDTLGVCRDFRGGLSDEQAFELLGVALSTLAVDTESAPVPVVTSNEKERFEEHDEFFGVERITGNSLAIFIHSVLRAYQEVLEEGLIYGRGIDQEKWHQLRSSFEGMIHYIAEENLANIALNLKTQRRNYQPVDPARRWRIGHHVFIVLIQCLVAAFNCYQHAQEANDLDGAEQALRLATLLMEGAHASLWFTGSFSAQEYNEEIRPSMMPPQVEPGFSGLQLRDHHHLMTSLKNLRATFQTMDDRLQPLRDEFMRALEATYDGHKLVCAHFIGHREPSLRMTANKIASKSAVDVIDDLKRARINMLRNKKKTLT